MSGFEFGALSEHPALDLVDEYLRVDTLSENVLQISHSEAIQVASSICTDDIVRESVGLYTKGQMRTVAYSKPVPYVTRTGLSCEIGVCLKNEPTDLFDNTQIETVGLCVMSDGKIIQPKKFLILAELRPDMLKAGNPARQRANHMGDLASFMMGVHYCKDRIV
ncbi:MAG TPA: hypothetical protein VGF75_05895 [Candidatus Saccharimonadales bacterium]|jgi:hypothetical protein